MSCFSSSWNEEGMNLRSFVVLMLFAGCGPPVLGGDVLSTKPPLTTTDAGEPCTPKSQRADWPVKVVFVVQNSGAMCVVDPPGSTPGGGFCDSITPPAGVTQPARVRAIRSFLAANAMRPNVSVALVTWGLNPSVIEFADRSILETRLASMPSELQKASNLQGALNAAKSVIESDIARTAASVRARTRYTVIVLGTGLPFPRCAANDTLPLYASPAQPELVWADAPGSGDWCNTTMMQPPDDTLPGFQPGSDLNQNAQLVSAVNGIMALDALHGLGDVRVHTRLVSSESSIRACGAICQDVLGRLTLPEARSVGAFTLSLIALQGQGSFLDPGEPSGLEASMASIDTSEFTTFCQ